LVAAHIRLVQGHDAAELVKIRYNFLFFAPHFPIIVSEVLPAPQTHTRLRQTAM
jgi:hypothetical protein